MAAGLNDISKVGIGSETARSAVGPTRRWCSRREPDAWLTARKRRARLRPGLSPPPGRAARPRRLLLDRAAWDSGTSGRHMSNGMPIASASPRFRVEPRAVLDEPFGMLYASALGLADVLVECGTAPGDRDHGHHAVDEAIRSPTGVMMTNGPRLDDRKILEGRLPRRATARRCSIIRASINTAGSLTSSRVHHGPAAQGRLRYRPRKRRRHGQPQRRPTFQGGTAAARPAGRSQHVGQRRRYLHVGITHAF